MPHVGMATNLVRPLLTQMHRALEEERQLAGVPQLQQGTKENPLGPMYRVVNGVLVTHG
jgi:hypothetical protein